MHHVMYHCKMVVEKIESKLPSGFRILIPFWTHSGGEEFIYYKDLERNICAHVLGFAKLPNLIPWCYVHAHIATV